MINKNKDEWGSQRRYGCVLSAAMGVRILNLFMAGIDFTRASIAKRERVAFVRGQVEELLPVIKEKAGVSGCVLLATCNRTELYLHTDGTELDPLALLGGAAGFTVEDYRNVSAQRSDKDAVRHLFAVASGIESQIFGDGQILSQVRGAQVLARGAGASDAVLDTLFRRAVTAGKRVRAGTRLTGVPPSAAERSVEKAESFFGSLEGKRAVVIGNGEMGRLTAAGLRQRGAKVTVTLRTYRHGETVVPAGCSTWPYDKRYELFGNADLVVSATTSPHFTVTMDKLEGLGTPPSLMIDLAMPRDIEREVSDMGGVTLWNLDDLGDLGEHNAEGLELAGRIIEEEETEFYRWYNYRESLPVIADIKDAALSRMRHAHSYAGLLEDNDIDGLVELSVNKTVDLLLGGMKGSVRPELLAECLEHIRKGSGK